MIKKWVLKAVVQKGISFLPFKHQINFFFQKYITKGVFLSEQYFEDKLVHFKHHWKAWEQYGFSTPPAKMLELGTGWYPVIPILFYLKGAQEVLTIDIAALMDLEKVLIAAQKIIVAYKDGQLESYVGKVEEAKIQKLEQMVSNPPIDLETALKQLTIKYLITDARQLDLPDNELDFIVSNNVFEHIYPEILGPIIEEFKRVTKSDGVMSHFIDMTDHFAHLDKTISVYHFLKFSPQQWAWIDNSVQPQNRMRLPQYKSLYQKHNIPVSYTENATDDLERLKVIEVDDSFKRFSQEELGIIHSYVVSKF